MGNPTKQFYWIFKKNFTIHKRNKKIIIGSLITPIIIVLFIYLKEYGLSKDQQIQPITRLLELLIYLYTSLLCSQQTNLLLTYFINQRETMFRKYQLVMALNPFVYTFSGLGYIICYTFCFLTPVLVMFSIVNLSNIGNLIIQGICYAITSCTMALFFSSLFTDLKVALQIWGFVYSIPLILQFAYSNDRQSAVDWFAMFFPNSAFSISVKFEFILPSLLSLSLTPIYLILYFLIEYNNELYGWWKIKRTRAIKNETRIQLRQEIGERGQTSLTTTLNADSNVEQNIIKVQNLTKEYKDVIALDNVNMRVKKSQILGLLGRNGAGKTTLVDIITKTIKQTSGSVKISLNSDCPFGVCYQNQILYEDLTVEEQLKFYIGLKCREDNIDRIILALGMQDQRQKMVKELSGGNKRKLSVGIAIIGKPQILIFDQPTSGLDPLSRRQVWQIIKDLKNNFQSSIILTTHHLDQADYLSDNICILEQGRIFAEGSPTSIKQKFGRGYYLTINKENETQIINIQRIVGKFIGCQPLEKDLYYLKYFIPPEDQKKILKLIQQLENIEGLTINLQANNLEQSFISIIKGLDNRLQIGARINQFLQPSSSFLKRTYASFLRCAYNFKSKFLTMFLLYFFNIFIILMGCLFRNIFDQQDDEQKLISSSIQMMVGYIIMTIVYLLVPVYEKQKKIISVMRTRGLGCLQYWLGTFLFDYLLFLLNYIVLVWLESVGIIRLIPASVILTTGISIIIYAYTASLLFQKVKSAQSWFGVINMITNYLLITLIAFAKDNIFTKITFLRFFNPYFDLCYATFYSIEAFQPLLIDSTRTFYSSLLFYFTILVIHQSKIIYWLKDRITSLKINKDIRFQNVNKNYKHIQALVDVNFQANRERLALLGHNGAGKSTMFNLLSCQATTTSGKVFVERQQQKPYKNVLKSAGICLQDDALWQEMTTDEILNIFSNIVGLKDKSEIKFLLENLQFEYSNKRFVNLSGGNKRKVCMAVAMMGKPQTLLLDQCSTGLDPSSRNSMISAIKAFPINITVFTTHSMPEAQSICRKCIILKNGKIEEFETICQLREKYYQCYWFEVISEQWVEITEKQIMQFMKFDWACQIRMKDKESVKFEVKKQNAKLSEIYSKLQGMKIKGQIKDFGISQPQLEDVYLKIATQ